MIRNAALRRLGHTSPIAVAGTSPNDRACVLARRWGAKGSQWVESAASESAAESGGSAAALVGAFIVRVCAASDEAAGAVLAGALFGSEAGAANA